MATEKERALIAPCGLNCGICPLFLASTDESLRKRIAEGQGIPIEEVRVCAGCRPAKGKIPGVGAGPVCDNYACSVGKKVEFCYECDDFPCLKLAPCADRAQEIPHNTKVYQLVLLEKEGIDTWLQRYPERIRGYRRGKKPRPGGDIQL